VTSKADTVVHNFLNVHVFQNKPFPQNRPYFRYDTGSLWLVLLSDDCCRMCVQVTSKADTVVHNFLNVPQNLEYCLAFGLFICFDSFLYVLTFLPLRFLLSAVLAFTSFVYPRCGSEKMMIDR
jgi:hypothetical protein